jgi:Beige/BEACH domain
MIIPLSLPAHCFVAHAAVIDSTAMYYLFTLHYTAPQYPVFPWVLADYSSDELDLSNPESYRDLSKPIGALEPSREDSFRERYASMLSGAAEDPHATPPFHYGTHYSSAAIVLHYLIRLQPFSGHSVQMQGGQFDHANRLFNSLEQVTTTYKIYCIANRITRCCCSSEG